MSKYRAKTNYAQIYAGDKQGFNLGLDGALYLRKESTQRVFQAPRIGTQGVSVSGATPSTDISAGPANALNVNLRGAGALAVTLTIAGANTGLLVAAALESGINAALLAAGSDSRVWVEFTAGLYKVHDQSTGLASTVVITSALANDVAAALKLGVANGGVETAGANDSDFLLYTTGGPKYMQEVTSNSHRSGRFHTGIIRKKKMAEFDLSTYINMLGTPGASIDPAIQTLWENLLGKETVNAGVSIVYEQGLPNFTFSLVRVSTIFGEYYNGAYCKGGELKFPGNGPATVKYNGKAAQASIAGIAQVSGAVIASTAVALAATQASRYSAPQYAADGVTIVSTPYVMVVDPDGRTILAGADGTLSIVGVNLATDTLTLSSPVSVGTNGYVVPWDPGAVQKSGSDNIFTDLHGSFQFDPSAPAVDVTEITLSIQNNHNDLDDRFGKDANAGFIAGNRTEMKMSVKFDLSNAETLGPVIQARAFNGLKPKVVLGDGSTSRQLQITAQKWIVAVPQVEVPENGPTPVTLEGILYQSAPGAQDPVKITFS